MLLWVTTPMQVKAYSKKSGQVLAFRYFTPRCQTTKRTEDTIMIWNLISLHQGLWFDAILPHPAPILSCCMSKQKHECTPWNRSSPLGHHMRGEEETVKGLFKSSWLLSDYNIQHVETEQNLYTFLNVVWVRNLLVTKGQDLTCQMHSRKWLSVSLSH